VGGFSTGIYQRDRGSEKREASEKTKKEKIEKAPASHRSRPPHKNFHTNLKG